MRVLTTGDVLKLIREHAQKPVPEKTFDRWCKEWAKSETATPVSGGRGTGNHRQWSVPQVVGILVAIEVQQNDQRGGCVRGFLGDTVAAFSGVSEEWLESQLNAQCRYYLWPHNGKPMLRREGREFGWPDVSAALKRVQSYASSKRIAAEARG